MNQWQEPVANKNVVYIYIYIYIQMYIDVYLYYIYIYPVAKKQGATKQTQFLAGGLCGELYMGIFQHRVP